MSNVVAFSGRKPLPRTNPTAHPTPWTYEKGFIWDAEGRVVGSTIHPDTAEWLVRCVNASEDQASETEALGQ